MGDYRNVGTVERWGSIALGTALAAYAIRRHGRTGLLAGAFGAGLLYRGITGYSPIYGALGISTRPRMQPSNCDASVRYGAGIRVEHAIAVARPAPELYRFWRRLETLPHFMSHVEEVTILTDQRSRWRVRAPVGSRVTWEAEIINDVPGQLIGWRSLPGSAIHHAGSVHFDQRDDLTQVRVVLEYAPPARYVGASLARMLGEDPNRQIAEDLQRFKAIAERGEHASL
ncbi:MAG: SRPBCC family protein [Vulcanimicrobiaceae bacterium]